MKVPFLDLGAQYRRLGSKVSLAVQQVLESRQFILKDRVARLESEVCRYTGASSAVGVASGSDAIFLSLLALGIGAGDEVITSAFTFYATAGAIVKTGAKPVFADIDPRTFNIDPLSLKARISRKTKAIVPVHLYGLPADMEAILKIARRRKLAVVEDAAQAFGSAIGRHAAGTMGDTGCYSFYPTKNLGAAGDGGMIVTSNKILEKKLRQLRNNGSLRKYYHVLLGTNSRLDEIQAAVVLTKIPYLDAWNKQRAGHARDYDRGLRDLPVQTPFAPAGYRHSYHLYTLRTKRQKPLLNELARQGIEAAVYYPLSLHLQPCFRFLSYRRGDLPEAEKAAREVLSLPMYPELSDGQKARVVGALEAFFKKG